MAGCWVGGPRTPHPLTFATHFAPVGPFGLMPARVGARGPRDGSLRGPPAPHGGGVRRPGAGKGTQRPPDGSVRGLEKKLVSSQTCPTPGWLPLTSPRCPAAPHTARLLLFCAVAWASCWWFNTKRPQCDACLVRREWVPEPANRLAAELGKGPTHSGSQLSQPPHLAGKPHPGQPPRPSNLECRLWRLATMGRWTVKVQVQVQNALVADTGRLALDPEAEPAELVTKHPAGAHDGTHMPGGA